MSELQPAPTPAPSIPLAPVAPSSPWWGSSSLGLTFGGQNIARRPDTSLRYTVIPLPVMPATDVTMPARADAISASYTGRLQDAVDLYRQTVEQNGHMLGLLWGTAHGLLGMPLQWQGDAEQISALADQDGSPGDWSRMFPESECAKIFSDAIGLGFGLGQLLLMCWRCDGVEWAREAGPTDAHAEVQTCLTCGAHLHERPIGMRKLYQLRWRDSRWLWRNPTTLEWFYTGRQGMVRVKPGDGEWVLVRTVPDLDIWAHGPWKLGTEAAIFARDSRYDRQNTSRACAPTHVYQATGPSDPKVRADVEAQADGVKFGNSLILTGEWKHEIHAASGDFVDVTASIVDDVDGQWEVLITGNRQSTEAGPGFANADVYARVTRERRRFYGNVWITQIRAQALTWWSLENFGTRNAPIGIYDTRSPEDKLAAAKADGEDGDAVGKLQEGYGVAGFELDPQYVIERAQARGVRIRLRAGGPLPLGGEAAKPPTAPAGPAAPKPPGGAPPPPAGPAAAPPALAGRLEDDDDRDEDDDDDAARLAEDMNTLGALACRHRLTTRCDRCGVKASYRAVRAEDGSVVYRATWRPIVRRAPEVAA